MELYAILIVTFLILYHFILYPFILFLISLFVKRKPLTIDKNYMPKISFIIAAYNEEKVIKDKIENTLSLDYDKNLFEIIVVSDGSSDNTHEIVKKYKDKSVVGLHIDERQGKSMALNRAVGKATGEILILSDANNDYQIDAIKILVSHFIDQKIGGVCGRKGIKPDDERESSQADGLYWKYESKIKTLESDIASITTADGEIFALRKSLYKYIPQHIINDDTWLTINILKEGKRVIYDTDAKAFEYASISLQDDMNVKIRMIAGGYQSIANHFIYMILPYHWYSIAFISHKLLRWLMPILLISIFVLCAFNLNNIYIQLYFALQLIFYLVALRAWFIKDKSTLNKIMYFILYFSIMNIAALKGLYKFITGMNIDIWKKAKR